MAHLFSAILLLVLGSEWIFLLAAADSSGQLLLDLYDTKAVIGKLFEYEIGTDDFRQTYQIFQVKDAQNNELPNWLYYNTSSNELNGVPLSEDLGRVFIEVVAHCILESYLCKDLSEIFLIEIVNSESSTEPSNRPPYLVKAVNQIIAEVGEYFEYEIDVHMFHDVEDGDTTHLALSLLFPFEQPLPKSFWLQLDAGTQVMYGLPLIRDAKNVTTVILTATDSGEASGKDAMQIMINDSILSRLTHKFIISFNLNFANFLSKRTNVIQLAYKIARYFGDANLDSLRVLDVEKGSLHLVWTNNSLLGSICKREEIMEIFGKMVFQNGSVVLEFEEYMLEYQILSITYDLSGPCLLVPTVHPPKTTTEKIIYISDFNKWVEIVIPALAAILVLIIVVLIVFIVCRHRKPSETNILKSEKKTFMEDRKPIIFPDELEMDDSSLKPKRPLVLPGDSLKNQSALESDIRIRQNSASMDDVFVVDGRRNSPVPPPYNSDSLADPPPYRLPPPYLGKQGDAALHV